MVSQKFEFESELNLLQFNSGEQVSEESKF